MWEVRLARIEADGAGDSLTPVAFDELASWMRFGPAAAAAPVRLQRTGGDTEGSEVVGEVVENVEEQFEVYAPGNPSATRRRLIETLQTARRWAVGQRRDMQVVAQVRNLAYSAAWYTARVFGGAVVPVGRGERLSVRWEREPYWRGPERALQVRSGLSNPYEPFVELYNCDDNTRHNWLFVEAPGGTVPAITRVRIGNTYAVSARLAQVRIGWADRPTRFVLEGEESELATTISNGTQYSGDEAATAASFRWTVTVSNITDFVGQFRVFANGNLAGDNWRVRVGYEVSALQTGRWVAGGSGWTDLGLVSLPPGGYVHLNRYPFRVWLNSQSGGNGLLDFLHFVPVQQYRRLAFDLGYHAQHGACIVDDGIANETYLDHGGDKVPIINGYGPRIQLRPAAMLPIGSEQMLTFGLGGALGDAAANRTVQVQIAAVPRWDVLPDPEVLP